MCKNKEFFQFFELKLKYKLFSYKSIENHLKLADPTINQKSIQNVKDVFLTGKLMLHQHTEVEERSKRKTKN